MFLYLLSVRIERQLQIGIVVAFNIRLDHDVDCDSQSLAATINSFLFDSSSMIMILQAGAVAGGLTSLGYRAAGDDQTRGHTGPVHNLARTDVAQVKYCERMNIGRIAATRNAVDEVKQMTRSSSRPWRIK